MADFSLAKRCSFTKFAKLSSRQTFLIVVAKRCLPHPPDFYKWYYQALYIIALLDAWMNLLAPRLDVDVETYKSESLPPEGSYYFRAFIKNAIGNSSHNHSEEFNIAESECWTYTVIYVCYILYNLAVPGQPSKPIASEITKDSLTLTFSLDFMGTGVVKRFILNITGDLEETRTIPTINISFSNDIMVIVEDLEAGSMYRFQVAAENDVGIGPYSEVSDEITTGIISYYLI